MFKRRRCAYVNVDTINAKLNIAREYYAITYGPKPEDILIKDNAFIEDKMVNFELTMKEGSKTTTYIFKKDSDEALHTINGCDAYVTMQHYHKTKDFTDDSYARKVFCFSREEDKFLKGPCTLLYCNRQFERQLNNAISYDVNSSYPWAMCQPMPNTDVSYREGLVGNGEVGFRVNANNLMEPVFNGYSEFIFPIAESPYIRFVDTWYSRKKTAKNKIEKQRAKDMMNFAVGMLQHHNPFIRCMILYWSNKKILDLMDENTLYCNTDCIVSSIERSDIPTGQELGEFKVEHTGIFKYIGFNYQWNMDTPSVRGTPKAWFSDGFDILSHPLPKQGNIYEFDKNKLMIVKAQYKGD